MNIFFYHRLKRKINRPFGKANIMNTIYTFCQFVWLQAIVGLVGGATRAALTMHQARRNNMADVSAKDGSQVCRRGYKWGREKGGDHVL